MGLLAVIEKDSGEFIGQCGITKQEVDGESVFEIGYLIRRKYWHMGYRERFRYEKSRIYKRYRESIFDNQNE